MNWDELIRCYLVLDFLRLCRVPHIRRGHLRTRLGRGIFASGLMMRVSLWSWRVASEDERGVYSTKGEYNVSQYLVGSIPRR